MIIAQTDYQATNGVVHYLDRVLASLPASAGAESSAMESMMMSETEAVASSATEAASSVADIASSVTEAVASAVPTAA